MPNIDFEHPFHVTEWDWFMMLLEYLAVDMKKDTENMWFEFGRDEAPVVCVIYTSEYTKIKAKIDQQRFEELLIGKLKNMMKIITLASQRLPVLQTTFSADVDVMFELTLTTDILAEPNYRYHRGKLERL